MNCKTIIDSLTEHVASHPEIKVKPNFEIYNHWALSTDVAISDVAFSKWILNYISDLKKIPQDIIKDASA